MKAEFVTSAIDAAGFPKERLPELAMVGRSNVGKSSLINALVRQTVARTSASPGKTRLANFYRVSRESAPPFFLVDLPGYGYARGGDAAKREFDAIAASYFAPRLGVRGPDPSTGSASSRARSRDERESKGRSEHARGVLHLVDSRHPEMDSDRHAADWLTRLALPRLVLATKMDKLTRSERVRHIRKLEEVHAGPVLGVSVQTGEGLKELWKTIDALLRQPPPPPLPPNHA